MLFKCSLCLIVTGKYCHTSDVLLFHPIRSRIARAKIVAQSQLRRRATVDRSMPFLRGIISPVQYRIHCASGRPFVTKGLYWTFSAQLLRCFIFDDFGRFTIFISQQSEFLPMYPCFPLVFSLANELRLRSIFGFRGLYGSIDAA